MLKLQHNFPLSQVTTLGIGGAAKEFMVALTEAELKKAISYAKASNLSYLVIGGGSNLLVSDQGYDGLVIQNKMGGIEKKGNTIKVKSGTTLQELVDFAIAQGLSGLNHLTGIPGTVGAAVYGNAGAYGQTISDQIVTVTVFDGKKIQNLDRRECQFGYRNSVFKKNGHTVFGVEFVLGKTEPKRLESEAAEVREKRLLRYPPRLKCPGSFFKNILAETLPIEVLEKIPIEKIPYGKVNAGYLLESVGAKGQKEGDIQVSEVHGNLFVNKGGGSASDFYKLAKRLAEAVKYKYHIALYPEVQLINLPPLL